MKTFTVTTKVQEGIVAYLSPYPHIRIGEKGRGRIYKRFPVGKGALPPNIADEKETLIERASVLKTKKGTLLLIEEKDHKDNRAIVHLAVPAGFRGSVLYTSLSNECLLDNDPNIIILAHGHCAQGAAGRMGGHDEYLVILQPNTTIQVKRKGRLYGAPSELILHYDGENLKFDEYDVVFPPIEEEEKEGILI